MQKLPESKHEFGGCGVAGGQFEGAVVGLQDLAREAEADAVALLFCGVERDEYLLLAADGDGGAVVADTDDGLAVGGEFGSDGYLGGTGFDGVADEVDEDAAELGLVGVDERVVAEFVEGAEGTRFAALFARQVDDICDEVAHHQWFLYGACHTGQFAVVLHEIDKSATAAAYCLQSCGDVLLVFQHLVAGVAAEGVAERGDGADGVHDFVGQHADELGPRLGLVLASPSVDDPFDAVQRAVEAAFVVEAEVVFAILEGIEHILHLAAVALAHNDGGGCYCNYYENDNDNCIH